MMTEEKSFQLSLENFNKHLKSISPYRITQSIVGIAFEHEIEHW